MRSLAADEAELWSRVTATIRPLSREPRDKNIQESSPLPIATSARSSPSREPPRPPAAVRAPAHSKATLDSSWDRKLRSGSVEPDRVLDLHGCNLDRAWRAIDEGLERSIDRGDRILLLITGHARPGEPPIQRGKIRAAVHDWLAASRHSSRIAAVRNAHRRHGGAGSLYIILRRAGRGSTFS